MKQIFLLLSVSFHLLAFADNPTWYDRPTSLTCADGINRMISGNVEWYENRVISGTLTEPSIIYTPDGIGASFKSTFHLFENGRIKKGYLNETRSFWTPDGSGVTIRDFVEFNEAGRVIQFELTNPTTLWTPDGSGYVFNGYVKVNSASRIIAGQLAQKSTFWMPDGSPVAVEAGKIVYLDNKGRLKRVRDNWDSFNEFEINRD